MHTNDITHVNINSNSYTCIIQLYYTQISNLLHSFIYKFKANFIVYIYIYSREMHMMFIIAYILSAPSIGFNTVRKKLAEEEATGCPLIPLSEEHVYSSVKSTPSSQSCRIATNSAVPFTVTFCSVIFTEDEDSLASWERFLPDAVVHSTLSGAGNPYATQVKRTVCETRAVEYDGGRTIMAAGSVLK